jgi:signal transduction histidine kinase
MKIVISNYINSMQNFVSHVSHEFKTPLMIMQSNLDIASKNNDYSRLIEDNNKSIKHLNDMLDSLLLMSNIQSEKEYNIIEYDI